MGIQHLNQFFKEEANSNDSIKFINLIELTGKKIAIDISIYMYRYSLENALIENMYLMLSIFRHYKIIPIFIFDGKSPPEKQNVLNQRYHEKKSAEDEYNILKNSLTDDMDAAERRRIELLMNK
jgi:5'-3' exonuclease